MQFSDVEIMKNITQPIARLAKLDEVSIKSLNTIAIMRLIDVNVCLLFKRVLLVNGDDKLPTFISCENLFEVCL